MAEREGFEPPVPFGTTVFKTAAFDHSAISPVVRVEKLGNGEFVSKEKGAKGINHRGHREHRGRREFGGRQRKWRERGTGN